MEEAWTILKVLQWTAEYFSSKGIEQPRADAEVLLAHVLQKERIQLYLQFDKPLTNAELAAYKEAVKRRALREPAQYITGRQEFWSLEFEVNPAVLIPRPETELIIERASQYIGAGPALVLDLGTGSGAIAVALAHQCPSIRVVACDKSESSLQVAVRNAVRHRVADRISFVACDLFSAFSFSAFSLLAPGFDFIVSNPPYVGDDEFPDLAPEVARYEPQQALRGGGKNGMDVIRRILTEAPTYLKPGGHLLMEFGFNHSRLIQDYLEELKHSLSSSLSVEFIRDYSGILRTLDLQKVRN